MLAPDRFWHPNVNRSVCFKVFGGTSSAGGYGMTSVLVSKFAKLCNDVFCGQNFFVRVWMAVDDYHIFYLNLLEFLQNLRGTFEN